MPDAIRWGLDATTIQRRVEKLTMATGLSAETPSCDKLAPNGLGNNCQEVVSVASCRSVYITGNMNLPITALTYIQ